MTDERTSYRFGPLERRGLLGPIRVGQAIAVGGALATGVELLDSLGGGTGVLAALTLLAVAVAVATVPVAGNTVEQWAPVSCAFVIRAAAGRRRFRSPLPTHGMTADNRVPPAQQALPPSLRGVELVEVTHRGRSVGALSERRGRLLTVVLACRALSFALLDPEVQERRLAQWGGVLATSADAPIRRLQWIERTSPAQGDELARWLHSARDPQLPPRGTPLVESYLELIGQSTQVAHDHEILLAVQLDTGRMHGPSGLVPELVIEQVGHVVRGLETAEIRVLGALNTGQLTRVIRTAFDPYARSELAALDAIDGHSDRFRSASRGGRNKLRQATTGAATRLHLHAAAPTGALEAWDHYRSDGALHSTYWISGWPRVGVSPMFMDALLADSGTVRTVAVTFEPVSPDRSAREVEAAITRDRADNELRRRFGQSETARQRQAQEAAARREAELAAGHAEVRLAGFVTVSGRDEGELRRACTEAHGQAARARLELRRMYGQQAEAFAFTLPLARGLR